MAAYSFHHLPAPQMWGIYTLLQLKSKQGFGSSGSITKALSQLKVH
jgi:hypothetical protein